MPSFDYSVFRPFGRSAIRSFRTSVVRSFGRSVDRSIDRSVIRLFGHSIVRSFDILGVRTFDRSISLSVRSVGHLFSLSVFRSVTLIRPLIKAISGVKNGGPRRRGGGKGARG